MHLLKDVEEELMASVIGGAHSVLVAEGVGPQVFLFAFFPLVSFRVDRQAIFIKGFFFLVKQLCYPGCLR